MPEVGVGDDEAGQEGADGEREPGAGRGERRAEDEKEDREKEELLAARRRDGVEDARDEESRREEHEDGRGGRLAERQESAGRSAASLPGEGPDEQHHRDDHQVSEDVDPDEEPPVGRVELAALDQELEDDDRRARDHEETEEDAWFNG